jgi:5'-methylthioadenosine phosphorylase
MSDEHTLVYRTGLLAESYRGNMLGIIGGTSLLDLSFGNLTKKIVHTPYGSSEVLLGEDIALLLRHQNRRAPHQIAYRAHLAALVLSGVDKIIAIGSTGSLKSSLPPGCLVIPDDYISLAASPSIFNHSIGHISPEFSKKLVTLLSEAVPDARVGGTYIQTEGPRIETVAEIRWMATIADVVGMTVASEATVARELDIPFAAICTVDNYANGITKEEITYDQIVANAREYNERTGSMLQRIISLCA